MKYTLTFTHSKTIDNKYTTEATTKDEAGNDVLYATILQGINPKIPINWEEWDFYAWNPYLFTGIMTTEEAFANAIMLNLSLEQYTNMLIAYHVKNELTANTTIEFDIKSL